LHLVGILFPHTKHIVSGVSVLQKDRQCTCNVTLRRIRATNVAVEKRWVLYTLCVHL